MADVEQRVACPHASRCGGCPLIALPYSEQLERKGARVGRALGRFPRLSTVLVAKVTPAEPIVGYRTRTKLVAGSNGIGLYGSGGHELVDLSECRVLPKDISDVVGAIRAQITTGTLRAHAEQERGLRGVDLRGSALGDGVLVTLIVDNAPTVRAQAAAFGQDLAREVPGVAGVFVAPHAGDSPMLLAPATDHVAGRRTVRDLIGSTEYLAGPGAFVQAHRSQAARIHLAVAKHVEAARGVRVLDLYAGGGGIGLSLAREGARVTLVEAFAPAMADARASAECNGVKVDLVAADAEAALDSLIARRQRFDAVVLNPPRRGCTVGVREKIVQLGPSRVAYVSCDPETLARDLDHFFRRGYRVSNATPFDMIPLTDEVETLVLLERGAVPEPQVIHQDEELLVVDKWPDEPPLPRFGGPVSTLERLRSMAGWERAVPLAMPDEASSGVCAVVRVPWQLAPWRARTPSCSMFVALVRGITHARGTLRVDRREAGGVRYKRVGVAAGQSVIVITSEGGSPGGIRSALARIGHPVIGDSRFGHGPTNRYAAERHALSRPFLHLGRAILWDPRLSETRRLDAPLAPDLVLVLERVGASELVTQLGDLEGTSSR